jgi:predicted site-specific integrase-resolvase
MPTTSSSSSEPVWLKPREYADREGVDRATVWRWVAKGLLEARRLGPRTDVRVREVPTPKG